MKKVFGGLFIGYVIFILVVALEGGLTRFVHGILNWYRIYNATGTYLIFSILVLFIFRYIIFTKLEAWKKFGIVLFFLIFISILYYFAISAG